MMIPEDTGKEHRRSWRDKLRVSDSDMHDEEGQAGLFTEAKRKAYEDARTYKTMKNRISLDSPELQAPVHLCRKSGGTYTDHYLVVGERVVKSKFCFIAVKLMDFAILIITGKLSGNSVL